MNETKVRKEQLKVFHTAIRDYLDSLSAEELSDHRWNNPDYKSPYDPLTRRIKKPEGLKTSFRAN